MKADMVSIRTGFRGIVIQAQNIAQVNQARQAFCLEAAKPFLLKNRRNLNTFGTFPVKYRASSLRRGAGMGFGLRSGQRLRMT